ncbi:hypothetical protein LW138_07095, partial [Helicobacter sp. faydin-H17]|nr:hypothetical protein [Helicobacter kayseriensis]MCE3049203.1 hypothetical protein [Helicobacter kayseriensis]
PFVMGGPCTQVVLIPPLALSQKKFNGEGVPLQEYASMIQTDKGTPLVCTPKPNQFELFQPAIVQGEGGDIQEIASRVVLEKPRLRLHLKDSPFQRDNIPLYHLFNDGKEIEQEEALRAIELKLKEISHPIGEILKQEYDKHYEIKEAKARIGFSTLRLVFIIPTKIPKIFKNALEEYKDKDYGIGSFKLLNHYSSNLEQDEGIIEHLRVLIAPAQLQKIDLEFALGLDSKLSHVGNVCDFEVIMGGSDEEREQNDKNSGSSSQEQNQSNQKTEALRNNEKENKSKNTIMKLS